MAGTYLVSGKQVTLNDLEDSSKDLANLSILSNLKDLDTMPNLEELFQKPVITTKFNTIKAEEINLEQDFTEIGLGKPLLIELITVYAGVLDSKSSKKAIIVTSAIREYNKKPSTRAVNLYQKAEDSNGGYVEVDALSEGNPISFYTPALISDPLLCTFEINIDDFDDQVFETISDLVSEAANIPIFIPSQGFFVAGSKLLKLVGKLLNLNLEKPSILKDTHCIEFHKYPGRKKTTPKYALFYNDKDAKEFESYNAEWVDVCGNEKMRLVDANKKIYDGKCPYVIALIDGREDNNLKDFSPQYISAKLLNQFFKVDNQDILKSIGSSVIDAIKIYNDFTNYDNAKSELEKLEKLNKKFEQNKITEEEFNEQSEEIKAMIEAYNKNILDEKFPKINIG